MSIKHKEIFISEFGKLFKLFLTIDIIEKEDNFILEAKKFKLKIESTNKNIDEAKQEFSDVFNTVIFKLISNKSLFQVFEFLNIKQKPINEIIKEKTDEIKKFNILKVNYNELMFSQHIIQNRIEPITSWQNIK